MVRAGHASADTTTTAANQVNVGGRTIGGAANGVLANDAVNVSQLTALNAGVAQETSARVAGDAVLQSQIDDLGFDLSRDRRDARAGTASALAAAGMPQAVGGGKTMISAGGGTYRGRGALAIGASHRTQTGGATFRIGVTYDSEEHIGANGGVGIEF